MVVKAVHPEKASPSTWLTAFLSTTSFRAVHPEKALELICSFSAENVTFSSVVLSLKAFPETHPTG